MRCLAFFLLFSLSFLGFTQEENPIDYVNKANKLINSDVSKATKTIEEGLKLSVIQKDLRAEAYCYNTLGAINYELNQYDQSLDFYLRSKAIFGRIGEQQGLFNTQKMLGPVYEVSGKYSSATKAYKEFITVADLAKRYSDVTRSYKALGRIAYNQKDYKESLEYYKTALSYAEDKLKSSSRQADILIYMAKVEHAKGDKEKALEYYKKAEELAAKSKDYDTYEKSSKSISDIYEKEGDVGSAIEKKQEAIEFYKEGDNPDGISKSSLELAELALQNNQPEDAFPYIKSSLNLSTELGNIEDVQKANLLLSQAYERVGLYDSALIEYKKFVRMEDSLTKLKTKKEKEASYLSSSLNSRLSEIDLLRKESELDDARLAEIEKRKKLDDEKAKAEKRLNFTIIISLSFLTIVLMIAVFLVAKSNRERKRANQRLALQTLRSQMNPHFIFNSLNSVNNFITKSDELKANKYLSQFSRLMRAVMENSKFEFVPLSSELEVLELYLKLEHARFDDKFDFSFTVDEKINIDSTEVPPMLIQPYIENAVWHGLRYKEEKGFLKVHFQMEGNNLLAIIEDDGIGREKSKELKTSNQMKSKSTAMKNIEGRLEILNDLHRTNLDVKVEDFAPDESDTGTRVKLKIPCNINKTAA